MTELINKRFGRLIVVNKLGKDKNGCCQWECKCDCGGKKIVITSSLTTGRVKSCGCLVKEKSSERMKIMRAKQGKRDKRLSIIWMNMKNRCLNPNYKNYKNYGGKGITVCDEWKTSFENFYCWAISNGYEKNLTLDRINTFGNYEPKNCRWVTQKIQQNNRTNNHIIEMNGESHTLSEWCEILNVTKKKIEYHLGKGRSGNELYSILVGR